MADLTINLAITGTVNGRKYSFTDTWTVDDIYDVGFAAPMENRGGEAAIGFSSGASPLSFSQDCPSIIFAANKSSSEFATLDLTNTGGTKMFSLVLRPLQFAILPEHTNGAGLITTNATATTIALEDVQLADFGKIADIGFIARCELLVAFQAST